MKAKTKMKVETGFPASDVNQSSKHVLYVEGSDDSEIIKYLLNEHVKSSSVRVMPIGSSDDIASAARAIHAFHNEYYFLIDRDYREPDMVEKSWANFPDTEKSNLLIWRKHELENYFLEPDYLRKSPHFVMDKSLRLEDFMAAVAQKRLYFEAVNKVIMECRESLRLNWVGILGSPDAVCDYAQAEAILLGKPEFAQKLTEFSEMISTDALKQRLQDSIQLFTGGGDKIIFGQGEWINVMPGKEILNQVINRYFPVKDREGKIIRNMDKKKKEVGRSLTSLPLEEQPADFQELCRLIENVTKVV
jgi:Protein of unknown function (DUF4435)